MQLDLEKILTHASDRLDARRLGRGHEDHVVAFKRFLKIETERLRIRHRFGIGGGEVAACRSYVIDLVVRYASQLVARDLSRGESAEPLGCALVALGGYGRQELAPFSDVDLLFLRAGPRAGGAKEFAEQLLYLLWDMGLTVGHSYRSVAESVTIAKDDLHSRNAMAEGRLLVGDEALYRQFAKALDDNVFRSRSKTAAYLDTMRAEVEARHGKHGRAVCVQEPSIKEGVGGLRDLHAMIWVGRAKYRCRTLDDLRAGDHLSGPDFAAARRAYDFLWRVRHEAHFVTGRATDLLTLDLQHIVAASLGFEPKRGMLASEIFMREYYSRAQELSRVSERFLARALEPADEARRFTFAPQSSKVFGRFENRNGRLASAEPEAAPSARHLLEAFLVAQATRLDLSDALKQTIQSNLALVDRRFRNSPEARRSLLELLRRKGGVAPALRQMHDAGFLGRMLPEFGRVTCLVQHDLYHKYTIDEHTLRAVEALDGVWAGLDAKVARFARISEEIDDAMPLYLGLLLHDIGKGRGGGHVSKGARIAERVCERLDLDERSASTVVFLVRQHLLLSHVSQRRNLSERSLISKLAKEVGSVARLNMLTLLTYADMSAVAPGVWSGWKEALLWDLYGRLRERLTGREGESRAGGAEPPLKERVVKALPRDVLPSEVERHFAMLPEDSLRGVEPDSIVRQIRMVKRLESEPLAVAWRPVGDELCTDLTVCARDQKGLFARIAGTLTANGINILAVNARTRDDGVALDTFTVCEVSGHRPVRPERWPDLAAALEAAVMGRLDVDAAVATWRRKTSRPKRRQRVLPPTPSTVRFDSAASAVSTVVEVRAEDEPGLAYTMAGALSALGFDITFAKIATEKNHVLDVFYVVDGEGRKLDPAMFDVVERTLLEALGALAAGPDGHSVPARRAV